MLREKLIKELGFETWREVIKADVPMHRMVTAMCSVFENELAIMPDKQRSHTTTINKLDTGSDPE